MGPPHGSGVLPVSHRRLHHGYPYRSDPVLSPGSRVLVDRSCHRSTFHALALLDLDPIFLPRPWLAEEGGRPVFPPGCEKMLDQDPTIKTVCITSPTYCGLLSDIPAIAGVVHAHGGKLVVDGAHGAHLQFLGMDAYRGADAVVVSAHKTLPAMGQAALLFSQRHRPGTGAANCRHLRHLQPLLPHPGLPGHGS